MVREEEEEIGELLQSYGITAVSFRFHRARPDKNFTYDFFLLSFFKQGQ